LGYFKKVNKFGVLIWTAVLKQCNDKDAVEINKDEYMLLTKADLFDDGEILVE
jgi:hypothetical protein